MKKFNRSALLVLCAFYFLDGLSQSITGLIIPGATVTNSGINWDVTFYSSTSSTTAQNNYKEIRAFEFKWNNTKTFRYPATFAKTYDAVPTLIDKNNFRGFI